MTPIRNVTDRERQLQAEIEALKCYVAKLESADMFWNHDDAERLYHGIGEFLNDEICNGSLEVGDIRTVQQARKLPTITIRIVSIDDEECDADWEVVTADAAMKEGAQ